MGLDKTYFTALNQSDILRGCRCPQYASGAPNSPTLSSIFRLGGQSLRQSLLSLDSRSFQLKRAYISLPLKPLPAAYFLHRCTKPSEVESKSLRSLENANLPELAEESLCLIPSNFNQNAVRREIRRLMACARMEDTKNVLMVLLLRQRGVTVEDSPLRLLAEAEGGDCTMLEDLTNHLGISLPEACSRIATDAFYHASRRLHEQGSAHVSAEDVREVHAAYMGSPSLYTNWVDNEEKMPTTSDDSEETLRKSGTVRNTAEMEAKDKLIIESVRASNLNEYERQLLSCVVDRSELPLEVSRNSISLSH
jgi:hypothetical protein